MTTLLRAVHAIGAYTWYFVQNLDPSDEAMAVDCYRHLEAVRKRTETAVYNNDEGFCVYISMLSDPVILHVPSLPFITFHCRKVQSLVQIKAVIIPSQCNNSMQG